MKKKNKKMFIMIIILAGIILFGLIVKFSNLFSIGIADDYRIYEDFGATSEIRYFDQSGKCQWQCFPPYTWEDSYVCGGSLPRITKSIKCEGDKWSMTLYSDSGYSNFVYEFFDDKLSICTSGDGALHSLVNKENFKGYDVKVKLTWRGSGTTPDFSMSEVKLGSATIFSQGEPRQPEVLIEAYNSRINPDEYQITVNGVDYKTVTIPEQTASLSFTGQKACTYVDFVRTRVPFNCKIEEYEVLVFDEFSQGSSFTIDNLAFIPTKICLNNPPIIRSFTQEGLRQDTRGEIFLELIKGKTITVPTGETYRVPYITFYKEGQTLRCGIGKTYNTKTKECEVVVEELSPEIIEILKEIRLREVLPVLIDYNSFAVVHNKDLTTTKIGDIQCTSIKTNFDENNVNCAFEGDHINTPYPQKSCWSTILTCGQNTFTFIDSETKKINDYIEVTYYASSEFDKIEKIRDDKWSNLFTFKISNFLKTKLLNDTYQVNLNTERNIEFEVENKLANFDNAGVFVKRNNKLLDIEYPVERHDVKLILGTTKITIPLNTSILGVVEYELQPFVEIETSKTNMILGEKALIGYKIMGTNGEEPIQPPVTPSVESPIIGKLNWWYLIFAFAFVIIIFMIIKLATSKKKR